jgi:NAD(P)-dependent dehydrogenase (short-subunit alcohol dehydrogenase family)
MSDLRFDGQVAIVTGAGRGLGRSHALALAARGACVVVNDAGVDVDGFDADGSVAQRVVDEIRGLGGQAVADVGDVTLPTAAAGMVATALREFGRLDMVVSNAGVHTMADFEDGELDDILRPLHVDVVGSFNLCHAAWRQFAEQRYGRIILTSSTSFLGTGSTLVGYSAGKGGVISLARSLADEGAALGIKVNTITPYAYTRMVTSTPTLSAEALARRERLGAPEFVSELVALLAHERCPTPGELNNVGNGRVTRFFFGETQGVERLGMTPEEVLAGWEAINTTTGALLDAGTSKHAADRMYARVEALVDGA